MKRTTCSDAAGRFFLFNPGVFVDWVKPESRQSIVEVDSELNLKGENCLRGRPTGDRGGCEVSDGEKLCTLTNMTDSSARAIAETLAVMARRWCQACVPEQELNGGRQA
jgi:hypothetical protein